MMNPYRAWVAEFERLLEEGKRHPLGGLTPPPRPELDSDAPVAMIFAPHPDDEVLIGGMALRLLREARFRIVSVAVTQGSDEARQAERWLELSACCRFIGFELLASAPGGLRQVHLATRSADPARWADGVAALAEILAHHAPLAVFFPHAEDWHTTHVGTHHLVVDAFESLGPEFRCYTIETEFWGASSTPNLMVELSAGDLADLVAALSFHRGELARNPYHLTLPAQMIDNVRRGGELVFGPGRAPPPFTFATLYRLRKWKLGQFVPVLGAGRALSVRDDLAELLR